MKRLYLVRHCKAVSLPDGLSPEAPLTREGKDQAEALAEFFLRVEPTIDRIVSSPFTRAIESVKPLSQRLGIAVETDWRLCERVLSPRFLPDWCDRLRDTFADFDLCLDGGESSGVAMKRAVASLQDILQGTAVTTVIATHGNLLALILNHFDGRFGFEEWRRITNPDVFRVALTDNEARVEHIWDDFEAERTPA